jgi:2'-hydroxyisoflavone reductase
MGTRREFLRLSALAAAAMGSGLAAPSAATAVERTRPGRGLRILVLGGTGFIGPHLVRRILERGHTPVLFNRGRTRPAMFPEIFAGLETLVGDRSGDISALRGGRWDAVIDDSGYTPQQVRATAELLRGSVGQYLFTSTRAVYQDFTVHMDEDAPVGVRGVPESEWEGYGPLKALAEREVTRVFPDAATIVRPAIITGPGDNTDRFTYWYVRVDEGGEVLAPGDPSDPIQYIDVRDLADFYVHLVEQRTRGVFNLEAPASPLTTGAFLDGIRATTATPVSFTWVDWDFLESHGLQGGSRELPAWRAPRGEQLNYGRMDIRRALAAGLTPRPLATTAIDTREWWRSLGISLRAGLPPAREREVLDAWRRAGGAAMR